LMVASFITLSLPSIGPQPLPRHFPVPFWVTMTVICRDFFILAGAVAINIFSGFRGFKPSIPGKINTIIQILAIGMILVAAHFTPLSGYLPTVYTIVVAFAVFSGIHYVFFVARLMNKSSEKSSN
ncbi:MAG: CDP-alcohol phosphatidyltransferase family protein, partial [Pyrinomonadaceae bacterium]